MIDYTKTSDGLYAYRWPRASVTADAVLFAERDGQTYVLLIQRGNEPYKGCWAFPGGFLNMDETLARCAERELEEAITFAIMSDGHGKTTDQIAAAINRHGWHIRKDGKPVTSAQVYAVICRYPSIFTKEEGRIRVML